MDQWVSNLSPFEVYLIAAPAIMLGVILFLGGIILRSNRTMRTTRKSWQQLGGR